MYVKLFASMFEGSLYGKRDEILVFTYMLAKADADGVVDVHPSVMARALGMPIADVKAALLSLESPDPESRTPDEQGRRIVRLDDHRDWGWWLVNYEKYKQIRHSEDRREQNKEAARRYRKNNPGTSSAISKSKRPSSAIISHHQSSSSSAHTDTDTDKDTNTIERASPLLNQQQPPEIHFTPPAVIDPLPQYAEQVKAEAKQLHLDYHFWRYGSLPSYQSDTVVASLQAIAATVEAFGDEAGQKLRQFIKQPPAGFPRNSPLWKIFVHLGLEAPTNDRPRSRTNGRRDDACDSWGNPITARISN